MKEGGINMDPKQVTKQMIEFNKTAFDNSFNAMAALQEQTERMINMFIDQSPWLPEDGRKVIRDWSKAFRKGREDFKKSVDDSYKKVETLFAGLEKAKTK